MCVVCVNQCAFLRSITLIFGDYFAKFMFFLIGMTQIVINFRSNDEGLGLYA